MPLRQIVPEIDSSENSTIFDVIGNKKDTSFSDGMQYPSIIGHMVASYNHVHNSSKVYPRTDNDTPLASITVTSSATALTFGPYTEITNFDLKTLLSDIHHVYINNISDVDEYVLQLATGESGSQVFWGESSFSRDTNQNRVAPVPIQGPPIPAGTKLWARISAEGSGSKTANIKVYTHEYPSVTGN